jgi:cytochrome P450
MVACMPPLEHADPAAESTAMPTNLPITHGSLLDFPRDPIACMRSLYERHGLLAALEENRARIVFAFGPEFNQRILSDTRTFHSQFFAIRGPKNSAQRRLTSGLLSMNGEDHKRNRRIVMGPFQKRSVEAYRDSLVGLIDEMLAGWRPGQVRNIFADMTQFMLRVTSSVLFGFDRTDLAYSIGQKTERWVQLNHEMGIGSLLASARDPAGYERLLAQARELEQDIVRMIDFRRSSPDHESDVLSLLIRAHDDQGMGLTDEELIGQAAVLFAAAHLTTANTLTWTLFLLAQHPHVAQSLRDELTGELHGDAPTLEQLERLPLLDRVVKESMRALPASSYSQRINVEPVELGPLRLSTGTLVVFSQFITHHLPDLFSEPYRFRPERWESIDPSPYAYLPFAAGPKMCIGATLATMTIRLTISTLWQRVRLAVMPGADINGKVTSTMLGPTTGMPMLVLSPQAPYENHWVRGNIHELVDLDWPATPRTAKPRRVA